MLAALVPVVDMLVDRTGLPRPLIEGLVEQESSNNPKAVSKKGAKGLTQLMPGTAKEMGLKKHEVFDPAKNLEAGIMYLSKLHGKYGGDMEKTLAAYNWGQGNVDRKGLEKMPSETRKYLARLLPMAKTGVSQELSKEPEGDDWLSALESTVGYQDPGFPSRESALLGGPKLNKFSETAFQDWYKEQASKLMLNPNPDDPLKYDPTYADSAGSAISPPQVTGWESLMSRVMSPIRKTVAEGKQFLQKPMDTQQIMSAIWGVPTNI